jgi:hypothetical protein
VWFFIHAHESFGVTRCVKAVAKLHGITCQTISPKGHVCIRMLYLQSAALQNGSTGQSSPTVYYGHSRRSSLHSNSEPPQEVSPAHVKFVRDTSRFWYKPTISREEGELHSCKCLVYGTFKKSVVCSMSSVLVIYFCQ